MSMYKQFRTDPKLESTGIVVDYGDFRVTVARAGGTNRKFARAMEAKSRPYRRRIQTETLDNDLANRLLREVYAETLILKWEVRVDGKWATGIENPDGGTPLPFNPKNVEAVLVELPDLFADLQDQSTSMRLYRQDLLEDDAGN